MALVKNVEKIIPNKSVQNENNSISMKNNIINVAVLKKLIANNKIVTIKLSIVNGARYTINQESLKKTTIETK